MNGKDLSESLSATLIGGDACGTTCPAFRWWCLGAEVISDRLNAQQMLVSLGSEGLGRPSLLVLGVLIPGDSQPGSDWHKRSLLGY